MSESDNNGSMVFAIISLICGILSIICCCIGWFGLVLSITAIVLGILSINNQEDAKGMAIAGIVCGSVGLLIALVIVIINATLSVAGILSDVNSSGIEIYVDQFKEIL